MDKAKGYDAVATLRGVAKAIDELHIWPEGVFGLDALDEARREIDVTIERIERRRESWRRASRKYRATKARERAQVTLFPKEAR